jgi:antitoxin HicB
MNQPVHLPAPEEHNLTTYTFKVVIEPDEDRWHAYAPALEHLGGVTWGYTREEALKHIEEVVRLVVESMIEHGEPIPTPDGQVQVSEEPLVAVTL